MNPLPHEYQVEANAADTGGVALRADGLPTLPSAPPPEFDGPGDVWSPESLLVAAVADCFVLTFRAMARASKLPWSSIRCRAGGTLDRVERVTRFVDMAIEAELVVPEGTRAETATRLLEKAEKGCLVTSSLDLEVRLETRIRVA